MKKNFVSVSCVVVVLVALVGGLGAQLQPPSPHPIFNGIKAGDRVEFTWDTQGGGWTIRGFNGTKNVETIGPDYIVYNHVGKIHSIYVSQIKEVVVRK